MSVGTTCGVGGRSRSPGRARNQTQNRCGVRVAADGRSARHRARHANAIPRRGRRQRQRQPVIRPYRRARQGSHASTAASPSRPRVPTSTVFREVACTRARISDCVCVCPPPPPQARAGLRGRQVDPGSARVGLVGGWLRRRDFIRACSRRAFFYRSFRFVLVEATGGFHGDRRDGKRFFSAKARAGQLLEFCNEIKGVITPEPSSSSSSTELPIIGYTNKYLFYYRNSNYRLPVVGLVLRPLGVGSIW